jgi:SHS2 domain-containing protein
VTSAIHARGATLPEAFARTALVVLARVVDPDSVEAREVREVRAHGRTPEDLLVHWVRECVYVHEVEGFAWRRIEFAVFDAAPRAGGEPLRLHAFLHGDTIDIGDRPLPDVTDLSNASVRIDQVNGEYEVWIESS